MLNIGSAWCKVSQETGSTYISIAIAKEIIKIYPQLEGMFLNLYENKNKTENNQPDYFFYLSLPKEEEK